MKDCLVKALAYNKSVKIYSVKNSDSLNVIGKRMSYYPSALDAVGRVMSMAIMIGGTLKLDESVTLKVEGDGPIGIIIAEGDAHGNVRAYCSNPHCHFEYAETKKLNIKQTVGQKGMISVIKDLKLREPYIGTTPIITGEIAEDFAYYFMISEQIPSAVSLGVLVDENNTAIASGGFILQLLPNASDDVVTIIENHLKTIPPVTELLASGKTPEEIIRLVGGDDVEIVETIDVNFKCKCSKERFANGILTLGHEEIEDIITKEHGAHTICNFCGSEYDFTESELQVIAERAKKK